MHIHLKGQPDQSWGVFFFVEKGQNKSHFTYQKINIMWITGYLLLEVEFDIIPQKNNNIKTSISRGGK